MVGPAVATCGMAHQRSNKSRMHGVVLGCKIWTFGSRLDIVTRRLHHGTFTPLISLADWRVRNALLGTLPCIVELTISYHFVGADKDIPTMANATPLGTAACNGHLKVVACLVEAGMFRHKSSHLGPRPSHTINHMPSRKTSRLCDALTLTPTIVERWCALLSRLA